jgi:hypothetical protein
LITFDLWLGITTGGTAHFGKHSEASNELCTTIVEHECVLHDLVRQRLNGVALLPNVGPSQVDRSADEKPGSEPIADSPGDWSSILNGAQHTRH